MADTVVVLLGGILDGTRVRLRKQVMFVWIDSRPPHVCGTAPKRHRVLYRRETCLPRSREWTYVYAGNSHALCAECGAYVERVDGHVQACALCGGALLVS